LTLRAQDESQSDFHVARRWENARKASDPLIHFHQIINSEVVGVNSGSFNVNISKRKNREGVQGKELYDESISCDSLDAKPIAKRNKENKKNSDDKINNIIEKPHLMESNQDDSLILKSADSKINQENQSLCSLPSVPSSNINCEEDVVPEHYNARKRTKNVYSWEDAIDKIDFRNTSRKM
ncbi:14709_t:CDS:2, partial [Acaulospora morrowiae]